MVTATGQPNRQFWDNMVNQLDDDMDRQKHIIPMIFQLLSPTKHYTDQISTDQVATDQIPTDQGFM